MTDQIFRTFKQTVRVYTQVYWYVLTVEYYLAWPSSRTQGYLASSKAQNVLQEYICCSPLVHSPTQDVDLQLFAPRCITFQ